MQRFPLVACILLMAAIAAAQAQQTSPRDVLEQAAAAMGGLERLQSLDNLVMTGRERSCVVPLTPEVVASR